jgi:hypothetical protein
VKKRTRTAKQIAAARANDAKSRGPITEEGKQPSSANATKHGLSAKALCLSVENQEVLEDLRARYIEELKPQGLLESDLVDEIVAARWRMRRAWILETATMDLETDRQAASIQKTFVRIDLPTRAAAAFEKLSDEGDTLHMLDRYEARQSRSYHRALRTLLLVQENRLNSGAQALPSTIPAESPDPGTILLQNEPESLAPAASAPTAPAQNTKLQNEPKNGRLGPVEISRLRSSHYVESRLAPFRQNSEAQPSTGCAPESPQRLGDQPSQGR